MRINNIVQEPRIRANTR